MFNYFTFLFFIFLFIDISISNRYHYHNHHYEREPHVRQQHLRQNENEIKRELLNELDSRITQIKASASQSGESIEEGPNSQIYNKLFDYLLEKKQENEESRLLNHIGQSESKIKTKRFLGSFFSNLFSKNKTNSKDKHEKDEADIFDFENTTPINSRITHFPPSSSSSAKAFKYSTEFYLSSSTKSNVPIGSATDDAFYKLKMHCSRTYDDLCYSKRREMYELVKKCEKLNANHKNQELAVCREVLSVYCYVYFSHDLLTCFGTNYDQYVPGKKFTSLSASSTKPSQVTTSTRYQTPSSASSRRISINVITRPSTTTTTTTKSTTTTTTTTTRPTTTTKSTARFSRFSSASTTTTTTKSASSNSDNPFEGSGSAIIIPNDSEKLKKVGNYCLKTKQKDHNCDKMLVLLKEKFKTCEKKTKADNECQTFKVNFCSAFTNFPCCPDVLAGRTCNGKPQRRDIIEFM